MELGETGVNIEGIALMMLASTQVVHVTFYRPADAAEFLQKNGGVSQRVLEGRNATVVIRDPNIKEKFIRISDFPVKGNVEVLKTRLREFGAVLDVRRERYKASEDYFDCLTGIVLVRMSLEKDIPNYLQVGDCKVFVRYQNQPLTCRVCDMKGHLAANCPKTNKVPGGRTTVTKPAKETTPSLAVSLTTNPVPSMSSQTEFPELQKKSGPAQPTKKNEDTIVTPNEPVPEKEADPVVATPETPASSATFTVPPPVLEDESPMIQETSTQQGGEIDGAIKQPGEDEDDEGSLSDYASTIDSTASIPPGQRRNARREANKRRLPDGSPTGTAPPSGKTRGGRKQKKT